jgi:hypothetical protein
MGSPLENMKGLANVSAIFQAPALEGFSHVSAQNISLKQYSDVLRMPTLKRVHAGFGSRKKNATFAELAILHGKNLEAVSRFPKYAFV